MTPLRPSCLSGSECWSSIRATTSNSKSVTEERYRERRPGPISRTTVDEVAQKNQCDECVQIDKEIFGEPLVSPCQRLLDIFQRTARCGTVRKLAAYRARPGNPRVLAGVAAGSGSGKETSCRRCGNAGRATRTAHTAKAPGNRAAAGNFHGKAPRTHTSRGLALCAGVPCLPARRHSSA